LVDLNDDKIVTYSTKNPKADFYAEKIKYLDFASKFMVGKQNFNLKVAGEFNISNALIAIGVLSSFGVDLKETAKAIELFRGVKRRLDIVGEHDDIKIIDDFAHNPDKIKASLSALKRTKKRLLVMFQPHGFAPTKFLQNEFVEVFSDLLGKKDVLVMPEIFFAGGTTNKDISSKDLIDKISKNGVNANFIEKRKDIISFVKCNVKKGDIVVIMGARDNSLTDFSRQILDTIKRKDIC
jgi:UDP-N-acetylmuramate--alanine ligase